MVEIFTPDEIKKLTAISEAVQLILKAADLDILYMPSPATVVVYHGEPNAGWYEDDLLEAATSLAANEEAVQLLKERINEQTTFKEEK